MTMKTKRRERPFGRGYSRGRIERFNTVTQKWETWVSSSLPLPSYIGYQTTSSEGHNWPPPQGSNSDVGGNFFTQRNEGRIPYATTYVGAEDPNYTLANWRGKRFRAPFQCACPIETFGNGKPKWPTALNSSNSSLTALGATAVSRCKPTSSGVELSTALGELFREGLPRAIGAQSWEERTLKAREAGGEYLNVQFGWLPLVGEVEGLARTIADTDSILTQYDADRGKVIRRQYSFPDEKSTEEVILSYNKYPHGLTVDTDISGTSSHGGIWSKKTTTLIKRWFSGAFVYGAPLGLDSRSGITDLVAKSDKLFGISLTPDVLWNLTPWSWATDWIFNTGDVLENVGDFISQGLVMQYGYLMETTITEVTYSLHGCVFHDIDINVPDATLSVTTKSRTRANPYGFGVTWDGLSATQTAILAALGMSRS